MGRDNMDYAQPTDDTGRLEARYSAFLETITNLRPILHRYCAPMTGSVMDGEDVVQEALFEAYRKLDKSDDSHPEAVVVPHRPQSLHRFPQKARGSHRVRKWGDEPGCG